MQLASAMAEKNADADAETAMRAYLSTFHCNYGGGINIAGGETDVELPGGNELIGLYSEYVNLANDLKTRKTALGMRPGIESEPILDSATSGLYDDISIGKTSGAYTSLARALMNPDGPDAIAWAQQKSDTAQKLKTGALTAGIGAVATLAGNLAINSGADKQDKSAKITAEYEPLRKPFENAQKEFDSLDINDIEPFAELNISSDTAFDPSESTITPAAKKEIEKFKEELSDAIAKLPNGTGYCIYVTGHTDRTKSKQDNEKLSENRANAVRDLLTTEQYAIAEENIISTGVGDTKCDKLTYPSNDDARCRKVSVSPTTGKCQGTGTSPTQ